MQASADTLKSVLYAKWAVTANVASGSSYKRQMRKCAYKGEQMYLSPKRLLVLRTYGNLWIALHAQACPADCQLSFTRRLAVVVNYSIYTQS